MPAKILTSANNKGGVGKTFLTKMLGEYAAIVRGMNTLLIDLDPQTNLSRRFLEMEFGSSQDDFTSPLHPDYNPTNPEDADWDGFSSSADIWYLGEAVAYPTAYEKLEIIPGHGTKLQDIELVSKAEVHTKVKMQLRDFLRETSVINDYDLVVIDTRPSKGPLTAAALYAATHLIIPSEMEDPSVEGLHGMLLLRHSINLERPSNDPLRLVGILPNKVQMNTRVHQHKYNELKANPELSKYLLDHNIPLRTGVREAMLYGSDSIFSPDADKETTALRKVVEPVVNHILERVVEA